MFLKTFFPSSLSSPYRTHRWVSLCLAFVLLCVLATGCRGRTVIVNDVHDRDANEIVVLLNSRGISAEKIAAPVAAIGGTTEKMWNISVPSSNITEALAILNRAGLPRIKGTSLLDIFGAQGLVPSDMQDKIRYQEGLSAQLATTIRKMDGIMDANVQITFPQEEENKGALTASVYVKHRGILDNPNSLAITKIKRLVSSAVPGLTIENVSVVADRALYADISLGTPDPLDEKEYVAIWGIIIAKSSLAQFRAIFYLILLLLFIWTCLLAWLVWKFYPIIRLHPLSFLFRPEPYTAAAPLPNMPEAPPEGDRLE